MNPNELYNLQLQMIGIINDLWELWLGATFAFVVAYHLGRESISKSVLVIGCTLYLSASMLMLARYIDYGMGIRRIAGQLREAGFSNLQPAPWASTGIYTIATVSIMIFGMAAATWYAIKQYRGNKE